MIAQKNVTHLYVGADAALAVTAAPSTARYIGIRRVGEQLCDATALVAGDAFHVLYMQQDGKLVESPLFRWNDLVSKTKIAPTSAASEKVTIGYNGTDGDIVETNLGKYLITIGFRDSLKVVGNKRIYKYADYTAGTLAKKYDIAIGLGGSLEMNMKKDAFQRVVTRVVCSSPYNSANGTKTGQETTVTKGSKYLGFETDVTYTAGGGSTLAVGDYIRIGTAAGIQGTPALGSAVYRVISISGTSVELDRPVTEASGVYEDATTGTQLEIIPKATAEAVGVKWGLILNGNDSAAPYEVGKFANNAVIFTTGISADFSTTELRIATAPVIGKGVYKDIADLDWELRGNRREAYRIAEYPVAFTSNAVSGEVYDYIFTLQFKDSSTEVIGGTADSLVTLVIASVTGGTLSTALGTVFTL